MGRGGGSISNTEYLWKLGPPSADSQHNTLRWEARGTHNVETSLQDFIYSKIDIYTYGGL